MRTPGRVPLLVIFDLIPRAAHRVASIAEEVRFSSERQDESDSTRRTEQRRDQSHRSGGLRCPAKTGGDNHDPTTGEPGNRCPCRDRISSPARLPVDSAGLPFFNEPPERQEARRTGTAPTRLVGRNSDSRLRRLARWRFIVFLGLESGIIGSLGAIRDRTALPKPGRRSAVS